MTEDRDVWRTGWTQQRVRRMPAGWAERVRAELAERRRLREEAERMTSTDSRSSR